MFVENSVMTSWKTNNREIQQIYFMTSWKTNNREIQQIYFMTSCKHNQQRNSTNIFYDFLENKQ